MTCLNSFNTLTVKDNSKKYGLVAGVAVAGYMLLFYLFDKELMLNLFVQWFSLLIYLYFMYRSGTEVPNTHEDSQNHFKTILRAVFVTFLITNAIYYLFYYLINNFDPQLADIQQEISRKLYMRLAPDGQKEAMMEQIEAADYSVRAGDILFGFAKGAIGGFVLSFIIAKYLERRK